MSSSFQVTTLLGKIVGVYKIGFKNASTGVGMKMDMLIIENLFYNKEITKRLLSLSQSGGKKTTLRCAEENYFKKNHVNLAFFSFLCFTIKE